MRTDAVVDKQPSSSGALGDETRAAALEWRRVATREGHSGLFYVALRFSSCLSYLLVKEVLHLSKLLCWHW